MPSPIDPASARRAAEQLTERTLKQLSACAFCELERRAMNDDERVGPDDSSWADLLCAVMEGLTRDWIESAQLYREGGTTHLVWRATDTGERAMDAYRRRRRHENV